MAKRTKKPCPDCGEPINLSSQRCYSCSAKAQWEAGYHGPRWKQTYCEDCGKPLVKRSAKRCLPCARKNHEWRQKVSKALKTAWRHSDRLGTDKWKQKISMGLKKAWENGRYGPRAELHYCVDCGKQITQVSSRCNSCKAKAQWTDGLFGSRAEPVYCIDCGQELVKRTAKRCAACAYKSAEVKQAHSEGMKRAWERGDFDYKKVNPSSLELQIAEGLEQCGIFYVSQYRLPGTRKIFDFFIPSASMLIEVDGTYWHNQPGRKEIDRYKTALAQKHGFALLRIPEEKLKKLGALEIVRENVLPITICICGG